MNTDCHGIVTGFRVFQCRSVADYVSNAPRIRSSTPHYRPEFSRSQQTRQSSLQRDFSARSLPDNSAYFEDSAFAGFGLLFDPVDQ
jgi:hypothetical protein